MKIPLISFLLFGLISFSSISFAEDKSDNTVKAKYSYDVECKKEHILLPVVRVSTPTGIGSGTIIYSEDRDVSGEFKTFLFTNHHVIASAITVTKKWNSLTLRQEDVEVIEKVLVEVFRYTVDGKSNGRINYDADIVAYDKDEDLALLQLTTKSKMPNSACIIPDKELSPTVFEKVYVSGCSLAEPPMHTTGDITSVDKLIDRKEFWMVSAPIIFGDSGGAVFLERGDNFFWIGIPSRVASTSMQAITHMGYIIPPNRIKEWIKGQHLDFLIDPLKTPDKCFAERDVLRKKV